MRSALSPKARPFPSRVLKSVQRECPDMTIRLADNPVETVTIRPRLRMTSAAAPAAKLDPKIPSDSLARREKKTSGGKETAKAHLEMMTYWCRSDSPSPQW